MTNPRKTLLGIGVAAVLAAAVACSSTSSSGDATRIDVATYDQSCQKTSDCLLVADGECALGCLTKAINKKDDARYSADYDRVRQSAYCKTVQSGACAQPGAATCQAGRCVGNVAPAVRAADYDRKCTVASDCAAVAERTACSPSCPTAAIAKTGEAKFVAAVAAYDEGCHAASAIPFLKSTVPCDLGVVACTNGACTLCQGSACSADAGARD